MKNRETILFFPEKMEKVSLIENHKSHIAMGKCSETVTANTKNTWVDESKPNKWNTFFWVATKIWLLNVERESEELENHLLSLR